MKRKSSLILLVVLVPLLIVGCLTVRGGGWIPSATDPTAKATFGFNLACNSKTNILNGQLEYHDNPSGVAFHGFITPIHLSETGDTCASLDEGLPTDIAEWVGPYRPQVDGVDIDCNVTPDACGAFHVEAAEDPEITFCPNGDAIVIELIGGLYDGYLNQGCLNGGNLTLFTK